MIKRTIGDQIWLVEQPDHARIAGFLAAHWGNEDFTPPGAFGSPADPHFWREQAILAIAEHDNGWIEWEEDPEIDPEDSLPLDFLQLPTAESFEHWRAGTARFRETHPFAALLISWHARLLQEAMVNPEAEPHNVPPFFQPGSRRIPKAEKSRLQEFVVELKELESALMDRAAQEAAVKKGQDEHIDPLLSFPTDGIPPGVPVRQDEFLMPHVRLLQIADSLSLMLCNGGEGMESIPETPRRDWDDRVTLQVTSARPTRVILDPFPFNTDPLVAPLPARTLKSGDRPKSGFREWRENHGKEVIPFELTGARR